MSGSVSNTNQQHLNSKTNLKSSQNFFHKTLKIIHQNAQVATNKEDKLTFVCDELRPDIFIVSEHAFNSENISFFKIPNYKLSEVFYRKNYHGGGVAIFVKAPIKFQSIEIPYSSDLDFEVARIIVNTTLTGELSIVGLYRSPNKDSDPKSFFITFEHLLNFLLSKKHYFVIVGDFNPSPSNFATY